MKSLLQIRLFSTGLLVGLSLMNNAQETVRLAVTPGNQVQNTSIDPASLRPAKDAVFIKQDAVNTKMALATCTDRIDYVGFAQPGAFKIGGVNGFDGVYQIFPSYIGSVIGVEFDAAKYQGSTNPSFSIAVLNPNSGGFPGNTLAGTPVGVVITNTAPTTYTLMFPSPITVSSGFGFSLAFYNYDTTNDSARFFRGPNSSSPYHSFITIPTSNSYSAVNTVFGFDVEFLFRPIISTSVSPSFTTAKTSTPCGAPAVYGFSNTSAVTSTYVGNFIINPNGASSTIDFGDNSPVANFTSSPLSHTYTTVGNYTASMTQTYDGWNTNCSETKTVLIVVDNPMPSFTYTINGLNVFFNNTSGTNLSSFVWNFGDLTTSTQQQPGNHTFATPGTYVVELEGTAACGKVKYAVTIVVSSNVGISESNLSASMITLYPNPASQSLQITNSSNTLISKIAIYNVLGKCVKTISNNETNGHSTIDVSDLQKGVYFIKLNNNREDIVKTFIKD